MKEHPLIFSAEMVRAILEGRKSVTRRLADYSKWKKGDTVWVRERWIHYQVVHQRKLRNGGYSDEIGDGQAAYAADGFDTIAGFKSDTKAIMGSDCVAVEVNGDRFRPSIHMPRWASRITLELTEDVRLESLKETLGDIFERDAEAKREGFEMAYGHSECVQIPPSEMFRRAWNAMHADNPFESNPTVSVINFKVIK